MTEQQPYEVLETHPGFELRRYPEHAVAEVSIRGSFEGAGNRAFGLLFGYLSGKNTAARSIAMTAPVVQRASDAGPPGSERIAMAAPVVQTASASGTHVVGFVLPASMTAETAPVPSDPLVTVRGVPERIAAAARYSGRWSESSYRRHLAGLEAAVARAGWVPVGVPTFARFDPPTRPWLWRRNEVVQGVRRAGPSDLTPG